MLKYLGFTLDDIRNMTIGDSDYHVLKNSLELQKRMIQDKIAQMQLVCKAIEETEDSIKEGKGIDCGMFDKDPLFSTCCDHRVAKMLAYDMLEIYLQELIFITGFQLINRDGFRGYMSSVVLLRG